MASSRAPRSGSRAAIKPRLPGPPLQYTNIAVYPDGALGPWHMGITSTHPPVLRTDGQVTWLPGERNTLRKLAQEGKG